MYTGMAWFVYILQLSNWKYYIGSARNLDNRMSKHQIGWVNSTKKYMPIVLLHHKNYESYEEAYNIERYLKKSKSRKVIEEFISN